MSDFSGLRLALTALQAQQRGVNVAAQNVANANTPGYTRQAVNLVNIGAPAKPALFSKFVGDGQGVKVDSVTRFRDQFLEIRAALEHGSMASLQQASSTMNSIQQLFNEPSDVGIQKQLSDFWAGFDDVANNPANSASRTQLLQRADTLAASFNSISQSLTQQRTDTISELGATVADINSKAQSIAQLNSAIKTNTIAGLPVNDLEDQRDLLANQLSEQSGATLRAGTFNQVNVVLNGTGLVQEDQAASLSVDTTGAGAVLRWSTDNSAASVTSGKAGGELDAINGTIPNYIAKLDAVATNLRDQVNALHGAIGGSLAVAAQDQSAAGNLQFQVALDNGGFATVTVAGADWSGAGGAAALQATLQAAVDTAVGAGNATATVSGGNGTPLSIGVAPTGAHQLQVKAAGANPGFATLLGATAVGTDGVGGRQFFTGTDASSLAVSAGVEGNPAAIAAGTAAGGPLDASNALNLANLSTSLTGADATYRQMIVQLGVDTQTSTNRDHIQQSSTQSLDNARSQQSGVSIDEEMTNLVEFQHGYDAAARLLTTIDTMLDTLINKTGLG
ncbi:MAG TPA: flagellar hook-associated protein FlgK [Acidimicrobiia bacterium]|jgi:flagellar hook-associated protein 1 FlgK|nr:flagellar hook-associated protein FlgK [Acidimicrobiia bacterium]